MTVLLIWLATLALITPIAALWARRRLQREAALLRLQAKPGMVLWPGLNGFDVTYSKYIPGDTAIIFPRGYPPAFLPDEGLHCVDHSFIWDEQTSRLRVEAMYQMPVIQPGDVFKIMGIS